MPIGNTPSSRAPLAEAVKPAPMPLFARIAREIRERILDETFSAHDRLPSEAELTRQYGVSRVTVRQALSVLEKDGLIFKINGKGTFVSKPKTALDVTHLRGFGEAMAGLGFETFSRVLSLETKTAGESLAGKLDVSTGALVTRLERLRYLNREPISLDITYIPTWAGERIVRADLERQDLISLLENDCGVILDRAQVEIESQICDEALANALGVRVGGPILHIERRILNTEGAPVLYENLYYRGDAFRYSFNVTRLHENASPVPSSGEESHD